MERKLLLGVSACLIGLQLHAGTAQNSCFPESRSPEPMADLAQEILKFTGFEDATAESCRKAIGNIHKYAKLRTQEIKELRESLNRSRENKEIFAVSKFFEQMSKDVKLDRDKLTELVWGSEKHEGCAKTCRPYESTYRLCLYVDAKRMDSKKEEYVVNHAAPAARMEDSVGTYQSCQAKYLKLSRGTVEKRVCLECEGIGKLLSDLKANVNPKQNLGILIAARNELRKLLSGPQPMKTKVDLFVRTFQMADEKGVFADIADHTTARFFETHQSAFRVFFKSGNYQLVRGETIETLFQRQFSEHTQQRLLSGDQR